MFCPRCRTEYRQGFTRCSDCDIDLVSTLPPDPPEPEDNHFNLVELYSPTTEPEMALIKSILEEDNIYYFVRNEVFGSMEVGPRVDLFNKKTIMVKNDDYQRASELIADFLAEIAEQKSDAGAQYSLGDKIRMAIEALLFGWFMPGKRGKSKSPKHS